MRLSCFVWRTFIAWKNCCYTLKPLLYFENMQDMMKTDRCSYKMVRWDWMALMTLGAPIFMFCVTDLFCLEKLLLYLKVLTIFGKCAGYNEKWQMLVHGGEMSLNGKKRAQRHQWRWGSPKIALVKIFTSSDFLGPIRLDSPNLGTSTPTGSKIRELSL